MAADGGREGTRTETTVSVTAVTAVTGEVEATGVSVRSVAASVVSVSVSVAAVASAACEPTAVEAPTAVGVVNCWWSSVHERVSGAYE
ncbi:hypothetical protein [Streptomyces cavernae]|uniref:hypothetical protein n=1 Tax=Streptomyces cavernae TaxID=2259034 RepID=UPI000FEB9910|nr:hypothetical protein [Streptomyces cavernae]